MSDIREVARQAANKAHDGPNEVGDLRWSIADAVAAAVLREVRCLSFDRLFLDVINGWLAAFTPNRRKSTVPERKGGDLVAEKEATFPVYQAREWQCRFIFPDFRCCVLPLGHSVEHQPAAPVSSPPLTSPSALETLLKERTEP